ncbi:NUDIX domain-containing protein [Streptomyces tendae]|uniref:NUDIX domain-containing protein n=1 Tax=Streptomyces tendae TaxID=1932 RepID=UPI003211F763
MTVGALLARGGCEALLIEHRAYGITLQPGGGHLEPTDTTLIDAAVRKLSEETRLDPAAVSLADSVPAYVEYGRVPARPTKGEPDHYHLDIGFVFTADHTDPGSGGTGAAWYLLADAKRLVGHCIARAVSRPARAG